MIVAARYTDGAGAILDETALFNALGRVVTSNPSMCVRVIDEETSHPRFERLTTINLRDVVSFLPDETDLTAVMEKHLSASPFDTKSLLPLWRVIVTGDGTVVFVYHHGIGDGLSGLAFHRCLFDSLQESAESHTNGTITLPPNFELYLPLEALTSTRPSVRSLLQTVVALFAPVSWSPIAKAWTGNNVPSSVTNDCNVRIFRYPASERVVDLCRQHKTSLNSLIYNLATSCLSNAIMKTSNEYKTVATAVPVSLRHLTGIPNSAMVDHIAGIQFYPSLPFAFSWEQTVDFGAELARRRNDSANEIGLLRFLFGNYAGFWRAKLGRRREVGLEVTNLGRMTLPARSDSSRWTISDVVFAHCNVATGSAIKLNVVGGPDGVVHVTAVWGIGAVDQNLVEQFLEEFNAAYLALLDDPITAESVQ